ncbi:MAG: hypothetical protein NTV07_04630 [Candidatus Omnitrophica bacterium]|nr:hypothetical protein [Candidatus Omnitrophota bacterium]
MPRPQHAQPQKEDTYKTDRISMPQVQVSVAKAAPARPIFFRIEMLNILLVAILLGLLIYLVPFLLKKPENPVPELEKKVAIAPPAAAVKEKEGSSRPPFSYFSEGAASKNIFQPIVKEETAPQASAEAEQAKKTEEIKSQLSLLGVVWGEKPQAIIEDKKAQKTYFLSKGETFDSIEVKDILENKVVLFYNGQQFELVL